MGTTPKVDGVFRTRSLGVAACGVPDQYEDGKAAKVWHKYIGDKNQRTGFYKNKLLEILRSSNSETIYDVACGTGIDSIFLVEEGFQVTSVDASDKMLKYALKVRWARRHEPKFDKWVIEEGNWLSLKEADIEIPDNGFDSVICMGNSFAHLPDFDGNGTGHIQAITNFFDMLKPGGVLVIDHRNYDTIVTGRSPPMKNIYYQSTSKVEVKTSVLMVDGKYNMVTLDYCMHPDEAAEMNGETVQKVSKPHAPEDPSKFRLSYFPHLLQNFTKLLQTVFGDDTEHTVLADFMPLEVQDNPAYYIHIIKRKLQ